MTRNLHSERCEEVSIGVVEFDCEVIESRYERHCGKFNSALCSREQHDIKISTLGQELQQLAKARASAGAKPHTFVHHPMRLRCCRAGHSEAEASLASEVLSDAADF